MNKLIGSQYFVAHFLWTHFFLSCWTDYVINFLKVMNLMSSPNCHLRFSIVVLETLKFEWQCSQYLELNPTCDVHHVCIHLVQIRLPTLALKPRGDVARSPKQGYQWRHRRTCVHQIWKKKQTDKNNDTPEN